MIRTFPSVLRCTWFHSRNTARRTAVRALDKGIHFGQSALQMSSEERTPIGLLCDVADDYRSGKQSPRQTFQSASPDLSDPSALMAQIRAHLATRPELVQSWQQYSWDIRGTPNHYMEDVEVGFYDAGHRDVVRHPDEFSACADFICRTAAWVLERRRLGAEAP
jgi:hypothetical protein